MSFIAKNPISAAKIESSPPSPLKGARGLFPMNDGWYDIDDNGKIQKLVVADDDYARREMIYILPNGKCYNIETQTEYWFSSIGGLDENRASQYQFFYYTQGLDEEEIIPLAVHTLPGSCTFFGTYEDGTLITGYYDALGETDLVEFSFSREHLGQETIFIGLDGYCYSPDGIVYSIKNLNIRSVEDLAKYHFVFVYETESTEIYKTLIPLSAAVDDVGSLFFSAVGYFRGIDEGSSYLSIRGYYFADTMDFEDAIFFDVFPFVGEYLKEYYLGLTVDKKALLGDIGPQTMKEYTDNKIGDVETALDSIIALQNSLIGGDGE